MNKKNKIIIVLMIILMTIGSQVYASEIVKKLYPMNIENLVENNHNVIIKTYELKLTDNPEEIPTTDVFMYGENYKYSHIIKEDLKNINSINHVETIELETSTNKIDTILNELDDTMEYSKDGFEGILSLDINSIQTVAKGYNSSKKEVTINREFPNLTSQDLSLIPKTVSHNNQTYTLKDINFVATNSSSVSNNQVTTTYKGLAVYGAMQTSSYVTGYITTANYTGEIQKSEFNNVIYRVKYISENELYEIIESDDVVTDETVSNTNIVPLLIFIFAILVLASIFYCIYNFIFKYNVKVYNQSNYEYIKISKLRIDLKNPKKLVDLNKIDTSKITSSNFILEIKKDILKKLKNNEISVIYKDRVITVTIDEDFDFSQNQLEFDFVEKEESNTDIFY